MKADSFKKMTQISTFSTAMISAMALSLDNSILAVGYADGIIEVILIVKFNNSNLIFYKFFQLFDTASLKKVHILQSHKQPITSLKFSKQPESRSPNILVSLSEQICFWNVTHVMNNQRLDIFNSSSVRTSQRFSRRSYNSQSEDSVNNNLQMMSLDENPWQRKTGASGKPELLSCIKFVGRRAEKVLHFDKFGKFLTIDNEGNVYYIRVLDDQLLLANNGSNGANVNHDRNCNDIVATF